MIPGEPGGQESKSAGIREVQRQYAREAEAYEIRWAAYLQATIDPTLDALRPVPGERVLDVGCGTGLLLRTMRDREPRALGWGVDLSEGMLRQAALAGDAARLTLADAHRLPFGTASFDAVVSSSTLHHWRRPRLVLGELRRVLRPRGRLIVTDWADDHLPTRLLSLALRVTDRSHHRTYSLAEVRTMLERAGFTARSSRLHRLGWKWGFMTVSSSVDEGNPAIRK